MKSQLINQTKSVRKGLVQPPLEPWSAALSELGRQWYIIRTRSRQEKQLAADLEARRICCFLPLVAEVRYHGRRKARVIVPLFPGYLFIMGTREEAFTADRSDRSAQLIEVLNQERLHDELTAIVRILQTGGSLAPCDPLVRGTVVEVSAGPFKGIRGTVDMNLRDNRFVLNVDMIGKAAVLEIDRDLLRCV
jgi:transcription antitermination factor NusG